MPVQKTFIFIAGEAAEEVNICPKWLWTWDIKLKF